MVMERCGTRENPAQKVAHPINNNLQLAAETCEFSPVPQRSVEINTDGQVTNRASIPLNLRYSAIYRPTCPLWGQITMELTCSQRPWTCFMCHNLITCWQTHTNRETLKTCSKLHSPCQTWWMVLGQTVGALGGCHIITALFDNKS